MYLFVTAFSQKNPLPQQSSINSFDFNRIVKHGAGTIQKLNELALDVQMLVINDLMNYFF